LAFFTGCPPKMAARGMLNSPCIASGQGIEAASPRAALRGQPGDGSAWSPSFIGHLHRDSRWRKLAHWSCRSRRAAARRQCGRSRAGNQAPSFPFRATCHVFVHDRRPYNAPIAAHPALRPRVPRSR
jgi:hypothetical protein